MRINWAHVRERAAAGGYIDFAVFDAKPLSATDQERSRLLAQLTHSARAGGLKVDQSALAYNENGQVRFYGDTHLVDYLSRNGVPRWTHTMDI